MDVSRDIRDYLIIKKSVSIPGLGNLYLNRVPASLDKENNVLNAPSHQIQFDGSAVESEEIIDHLASKYDISKKAASKEFKKYSFGILNRLLNYGKVEIQGLGMLMKSEDDKIVFSEDDNQSFLMSNYLPKVKAIPIPKMVVADKPGVAAVKAIPPITPVTQKRKYPEWLEYAAPFVGFALLILIGYFAWNAYKHYSSESDESTELMEENPRLNKNPDSVLMSETYSKEDRDDSFRDEEDVANDGLANGSTDLDLPAYEAENGEEENVKEGNINNENPKAKVEDDATENTSAVGKTDIIDAATDEIEEEKLDTEIEINSKYSGKGGIGSLAGSSLKPFQPEPYKCVIVVGSFKRQSYVSAMISKLQKLGHEHFTQSYNGFTRVGVVVSCKDETEVLSYLNQIKENVEKNAWILN
jgi:hypothetical protein